MNKVKVDLSHCYGIKGLKYEFDFSNRRAYAIYAPNGVMKSSFALTFRGLALGNKPEDRAFPARVSSRKITDETGAEVSPEKILVVLSYDGGLGLTKRTSTLLVDETLRKQHEQLTGEIDDAEDALLKAIAKQSGSKRNFKPEIAQAFASNDLQVALTRIQKEIKAPQDTPFGEVAYDVIFDDKVLAALDAKDLKKSIKEYIERYNELLAKSTYFRKGTFDYYNAGEIAKTLTQNGFFAAKHTLNLKGPDGKPLEIQTKKDLEDVISKEKDEILKDAKLRKSFDGVAEQLAKNVTLRDFQTYLMNNEALLSRMDNVTMFKQDIFKSYIKIHENLYNTLLEKYAAAEAGLKNIKEEAEKQKTQWQAAIDTFNQRFVVPFTLVAENKIDVMLGRADLVSLSYTYSDQDGSTSIEQPNLVKILSNGELKALYILNVLFEMETRMKAKQETLIIVDDLADSFDYRNKYAIVQYLKEISENELFKQIIMTHNFDFFRTIQGRLVVDYANCLMAAKNKDGEIALDQAAGIKNVFANWRDNFFVDPKKKIACIPFLRNLVEFGKGRSDPNYLKLTSLLHWKNDTPAMTVSDLDAIFSAICAPGGPSTDTAKPVCDLIKEQADICLAAHIGTNFEHKIVLAIAIRLAAEQFIIGKINDPAYVEALSENQTSALIAKYKKRFPDQADAIKVLNTVALMTPENIHLNSFMYEPIIDMSDEHLKKLYSEVKNLA